MTRPRQDLLDAANRERLGCAGGEAHVFAFALTPEGQVCVYADGILEPVEALTPSHVALAVLRAQARGAEVREATVTVQRLEPGVPTEDDVTRMQQIQDFVERSGSPTVLRSWWAAK